MGLVIAISGAINKMSSGMATLLFYVFAVVNGLALWPIFAVYTGESLTKTFLICAGTFGFMSIYGYFTNRDLSRMGSLLFMALIGLIIASLVNIFLHSLWASAPGTPSKSSRWHRWPATTTQCRASPPSEP